MTPSGRQRQFAEGCRAARDLWSLIGHFRSSDGRVQVPLKRPLTAGRYAVSSAVQVTDASAIREERTLQYLVIASSTARVAFSFVAPGAVMLKCKMAEAKRRGVESTRSASTRTLSA